MSNEITRKLTHNMIATSIDKSNIDLITINKKYKLFTLYLFFALNH